MKAGDALERALRVQLVHFRGAVALLERTSRPWASVTLSGERHRFALRLEGADAGAAADGFVDGLAEREFDLPGHVLADIVLAGEVRDGDVVRLTLEALTVVD